MTTNKEKNGAQKFVKWLYRRCFYISANMQAKKTEEEALNLVEQFWIETEGKNV